MAGTKYLISRLKKVLEHTGTDVSIVAEYISTFDPTTQRNDMKTYLRELAGGREVEISDIVEEYCKRRMKKETAPSTAQAPATSVLGSPCGCMATHHDLIGSCISCHRLHCTKEVNLKCVACGCEVKCAVSAQDAEELNCSDAYIAACKQKDKLLQFDKENAARTKVHDAQGDYYVSSAWLSDAERAAIDKREAERKQRLQEVTSGRSNRFAFDGNSRKMVSVQDGDDDFSFDETAPPSLLNSDLLSSRRSHTASAYLELREKLMQPVRS